MCFWPINATLTKAFAFLTINARGGKRYVPTFLNRIEVNQAVWLEREPGNKLSGQWRVWYHPVSFEPCQSGYNNDSCVGWMPLPAAPVDGHEIYRKTQKAYARTWQRKIPRPVGGQGDEVQSKEG